MKRTAAAVLALSMAVSAVAAPASAAYICDVSQGNVEVSVDTEGNKSIKVGGVAVEDNGDGKDEIIITGDNTKPTATESLNAEEENTSEAEKSGENTSEVEKSGETKTEGKDKTQNSAAEGEAEGDEPTSQELLAPEDEEKKDEQKKTEQKPAETQEPEQDKKTEKTSDQVIEYGQYDAEAQQEAAKPVVKPAAEQKAEEKKPAAEVSYEATNAPASFTEKAQEAARNVVSIFNSSAEALKVILRNLKVDAGDTKENAVTVSGTGDVTLELDGKNELTGGSGDRGNQNRRANGILATGGWDQYGSSVPGGKLTIQGKEGSSLSATGGAGTTEDYKYGGNGIEAEKMDLVDATVTATGGACGGDGVYTHGEFNIKNSKLTANSGIYTNGKVIVGEGSEVIAIGNDAKTTDGKAQGGAALGFWGIGSGYEVQKGGKLTAIGGNAESESGDAKGGNALWGEYGGIVSAGETTLIGGNAKSGSGKATGGNAIEGDSYYFTQVTVKEGTFTAAGGKAESATSTATNGNSVKITPVIGEDRTPELKVEEGGTFVTAKPGESDDNGNGITGKIEINTAGGKIEEVKNAEVVKKDDGTVEVVGDLVGVETGNLKYELTATVQPTCTTPGKRVYTCTTEGHKGETYEETIDALGHHFVEGVCTRCGAPEQAAAENGGSSAVTLTVTGAGAYETSIADGRYIIAVPAETAVLSGCLGNLKELKAQGVNTLVFRTQLRETSLNIDSMLSLGVDGTLFTLTHSGESAELTVGGFAHNELLH
jgi:outer membrane biosynthesis protein TonB